MIKHCIVCGKEFETSGNRKICYDRHVRICEVCGKEFDLKWPYTQKTCSNSKCRAQHTRSVANSKKRMCELCGKEFIPKSPRQKFCTERHYHKCEICGKEFEYTYETKDRRTCGSEECIQQLRERTNIGLFGSRNAMQSDIIKERLKSTNQSRYGVNWPGELPEIREKMSDSLEKRLGKRFPSQIPECREKFESTMESKYGGKYTMNSQELREKVIRTMLKKYNVPYYCMTDEYHKFQRNLISKINKKFGDMLEMNGINYAFEYRIQNRSYDICIPDYKILVDIHPTITHNSYMSIYDKASCGLDKSYHYNKTQLAESSGWRCINVFDWDSWNKLLHIILPECNIYYARNLDIKYVSNDDCNRFEEANHLQGSCYGQTIRLGLFNGDKLLEVMTFGTPRYSKKYDWELLRICTEFNSRVIGGASKLFKFFIRNHGGSIISYCDYSKFSGAVYANIGMTYDHSTPPAKVWSRNSEKITDNLLRQRGYDQLFKTNYGKGTSNEQLMLENGWLPVYDCGQKVYVYE